MIRYLALGDSYTIGEGVSVDQRWPMQLAARLRSQGIGVNEPIIVARTGWTTAELQSAIERSHPGGVFDLVSLQIGVNNQYRGLDLESYRLEFRMLLGQAIEFAGGDPQHVIVLSIPDWGVTPFAAGRDHDRIAQEIARFNAVNRQEADMAGVRYVDVTPESRKARSDPGLLAADGLHPSGRMYATWVDLVLPQARAALDLEEP